MLGEQRTPLPGGDRRNLDAAWGSPKILLVCGEPALGPTTDPCITVNGVDWVFTEERGAAFVFRTYGTDPSMLVSVPDDYGRQDAASALVDLEAAAKKLPKNGRNCD